MPLFLQKRHLKEVGSKTKGWQVVKVENWPRPKVSHKKITGCLLFVFCYSVNSTHTYIHTGNVVTHTCSKQNKRGFYRVYGRLLSQKSLDLWNSNFSFEIHRHMYVLHSIYLGQDYFWDEINYLVICYTVISALEAATFILAAYFTQQSPCWVLL